MPLEIRPIFDDPNLVSAAGSVPVMRLGEPAGLYELLSARSTVHAPNPVAKTACVIGGMLAGADSIDDVVGLLRHGRMGRVFAGVPAPSTLGTFLRSFTHGHVQQFDAVGGQDADPGADHGAWFSVTVRMKAAYR